MALALIIIEILFGGILATGLFFAIQRNIDYKKELFTAVKEEYIKIYSPYVESDQASRRHDIQGKTEKEIVKLAKDELIMLEKRIKAGSKIIENDYKLKHIPELSKRLNDYNKFKTYYLFE